MREVMERMDGREIAEWMAFYELEPWGGETDDIRAALNTSLLYNINRGNNPAKGVDDFRLGRVDNEPEPLTADRIRAAFGPMIVRQDD